MADKELAKRIAGNTPDQKALDKRAVVRDAMQEIFDARADRFRAALGAAFSPEFFLGFMRSAISASPKLQQCMESKAGRDSVYAAAMKCAQLRLIPNTDLGQVYLIPYFNSKGGYMRCEAQIGRSGWVALVMRNPGFIESVGAVAVFESDTFEHDLPTGTIKHKRGEKRARNNRGAPIVVASYAYIKWKGGGYTYEVLETEDLERIRKIASEDSFGWTEFPDRMAQRSALVRLLKVWGSATGNADLVEALVSERIGQEVYLDEDGTTIDGDTGEVLSEPEEPPPSAPPARNGDIVLPPKAPPGARVRLLRVATEKKLGKTAVEAILAAAGTSWEGVDKASEAEVQALIAKIEEAALDNTKT